MAARPRVYRAEGVILRRRNLGEADSILTVFSGNEGKFEAIARGVRKARSRMRGHLEPLTRSRVLVARGRNLDVFTQAETVDAYRAEPQGLFCQRDRSAEHGRMLLLTWYDGLNSWQASRQPPQAARENFQRRHALTNGTVAYATRLVV